MKQVLAIIILIASTTPGFSQNILNKEILVKGMEGPIKELLSSLTQTTGISFSYSSDIDVIKHSRLNAGTKTLHTCLNEIFKDEVSFVENRHKIILTRNSSKGINKAITIKGKIIDKKTNDPVVAANIFLGQQNIGTISDEKGQFFLTVKPSELLVKDFVSISFLGYETERIKLPSSDTLLTVSLKPSRTNVNEVVIEHHNPDMLIQRVIDRIPYNYEAEPVMLTAFFREKVFNDSTPVAASEALVEVLKESYLSWRFDQVHYLAGRSLKSGSGPANYTVEGGLYYNLKPDIIKNRAEFLTPDKTKNFTFKYHGLTRIDEFWCFIVSFVQQTGESLPHYSGYLYIDRESFGIVKAVYFPNLEVEPERVAQMFVVKHPLTVLPRISSINYTIDYRMIKGKWHLHKVKSNVDINFKFISSGKVTNYTTLSEYIVINANYNFESDWNKSQSTSRFDILQEQIAQKEQYLWSSSKINTNEAIEYTVASILRDNPFITSNLFDHRDYIIVPTLETEDNLSDNKETTTKDKVFLTKSNNISVYSTNTLYLGKKIEFTNENHFQVIPEDITEPTVNDRLSKSTAAEIIRKVVQGIPRNYPSDKFICTAYYREEISSNGKLSNISDALVNITKERYTHWHNDEIRLVSGRTYSPDKDYKKYNFVLQGGLTSNLQIDVVKYRASFLDPNYFEYYNYSYSGTDSLNNRKVYVINFDQKDNVYYPFFKGTLYIDTESYAVVGADYGYSPKMMDMATNLLIVKSPDNTNLRVTNSSYKVAYTFTDSIWSLQHISGSNTFSVEEKRANNQVKLSEFTTSSQYLITHISKYIDIFENSAPVDQKEVLVQKIKYGEQLRNDIWQGLSILREGSIFELTNDLFSSTSLAGEYQTVQLQ